MRKPEFLLKILISLSTNDLSRKEVNYLIELSQSFAFTYLKYRYKNLHKVFLAEDTKLDELAIDAIAPLFERNDQGVFVKIKTAFENWQPPIETEEQAQFFLNRIATKSVEKYVSELLRNSDPFFAKILDSVNYQIEKLGYKKEQMLGTTYITTGDPKVNIGCLPNSQLLNELPSELFKDVKTVIPKLIVHLKANTYYEAVIPLNALVIRLKKFSRADFPFRDNFEIGNELSINSILEIALKSSIVKLNESYFNKGKISVHEKEGIEKALQCIAHDLRDGGINPGLHKYFLEQFPEKSNSEYESNFQNIFEYLYKLLRKEIVKQLDCGL